VFEGEGACAVVVVVVVVGNLIVGVYTAHPE
jgi:hypothetical protein